ncbi:MAG: cell division protein FtsQ/DivIB [Bacteroidales bacterium]|nr:cell division protein FtsQ/DivIB [Bacteroidales bacterium]
MVKKILRIVLWVVTGAALIVLFVAGRKWYLETPLKGIQIHLERSHSDGFVQKDSLMAYAEAVSGLRQHAKISSVDMQRISKLLSDNPWIERGSAFIDLNDTLSITAKEYEPVLRVFGVDGRSVYVTAEGTLIPSSPHYTPHLLIASGNFEEQSGIAEALAIAQAINADAYLTEHIGQIYRNQDQEFEVTVNNLPAKVILGDTTDLDSKLLRLRTLLEKYNNTEELIEYKTLDIKYKNQIVCTKK